MNARRASVTSWLAGIANLILASLASANFAPRFWGDPTGEPWGLKNVAILHERLFVDMRPLADASPVRVEITYDLSNEGAARHFDLLFISGEVGISDFEASLGDQPLRTQLLPANESRRLWEQAPSSWRPPSEAPGIAREKTYYVLKGWNAAPELVALSLELPSGPSRLHVRYRTRACGAAERPTVTWQLPYVLAPAREWGRFGRLEVTVQVPPGWDTQSTPALERDGDTLRGSFTELPADAVLLATGRPVPSEYYWAVWLSRAAWVAVLVGGPLMCLWAGRRLGRACASTRSPNGKASGRAVWRGLGLGFLPALVWGALIYAWVPVSVGSIRATLHGQENPEFGDPWFAIPCFYYVLIPAAVALGVVLAIGSASHAANAQRAKTTQRISPK
jgi:hypothetical protein